MLETKGLCKIYKPKKGVPVTALKDVNICFPDKGMVFLLGKSGSGKSTLLNVLGGLDRYDQGEIIIKGVTSRSFKQKHFDSYRNTYVGFIFQEYNILEEFTVGANIALALQLQGKKATDAAINEILCEVDLEGYGNRRPNELSGGQKQRVAIARALVKKPEIIMADEPTGALDSVTGRQVLETLKKLSKDRLVIVVSHDREFAERYADRIIELADGEVIRDVERCAEALPEEEQPLTFEEDGIAVRGGYQLTEEDRLAINAYLAGLNGNGVKLHLQNAHGTAKFQETDPKKIPHRDGANFKLIKSKLPMKNAFRIGGSSLKYKKIRLAMTILLSCIAFGLFGLSDTFGAYNHVETCTNSMMDSNISYVSIQKELKVGEGMDHYWMNIFNGLEEKELKAFEEKTGVRLAGVRSFEQSLNFEEQLGEKANFDLYAGSFSGFSVVDQEDLGVMGFSLTAGKLPAGAKNEVAVSQYLAEGFLKSGYRSAPGEKEQKITSYADLIGKKLTVDGVDYTIVGIVDTKLDMERYKELGEDPEHLSTADSLLRYALQQEFNYAVDYSLARVAMVSQETFAALEAQAIPMSRLNNGAMWLYNDNLGLDFFAVGKLSDFKSEEIIWADGPKKVLAENEIILAGEQAFALSETGTFESKEQLVEALRNCQPLTGNLSYNGYNDYVDLQNVKIVGVLNKTDERYNNSAILPDWHYEKLIVSGEFDFAVGALPTEKSEIRAMTAYCYEEKEGGIRYPLLNSVTYELDTVHEVLLTMAKIFLYIGLGFALFASLMLANFIAVSISYKKQEIGILRAIGSRSNDVFRIFFSESFIIAMINFVLSAIGTGVATAVVNHVLRQSGILISVLTFGPRQILLLFAVSILVAALASFFPVRRIAAKRPIDAIRDR